MFLESPDHQKLVDKSEVGNHFSISGKKQQKKKNLKFFCLVAQLVLASIENGKFSIWIIGH